jgi:peptidyl-prolyl cis-trans isomerase A (cyclophilin A)
MIRAVALLGCLTLLAGCGDGGAPADATANSANNAAAVERAPLETGKAAKPVPLPDMVRVRLETEAGPILVALDARRAPVTTANFVRYVEEGRFDGTTFYRASLSKGAPKSELRGFIQGGIRRDYRRTLPPIAHEPTSKTGIRHEPGTISMARADEGAAMGNFFITTSAMRSMDAGEGKPGYAAFGRVEQGMDVVRRILAAPTEDGGRGAMRGQMLAQPVRIVTARRVE